MMLPSEGGGRASTLLSMTPTLESSMVGYMAEMVLKGRSVLFIGGGRVALRKLTSVLACGARITIIAPELHPSLVDMVDAGHCVHHVASFSPSHLEGTPSPALVFAVTGEASLNKEIAQQCAKRGLWCNSADDPASSSFLVPAVVRQGPVTLAVASSGCSPALSRLLKEQLQAWLEPGWGPLVALFGSMRARVKEVIPDAPTRHAFWRQTCLAVLKERRYEVMDNAEWFATRITQEQKRKKVD